VGRTGLLSPGCLLTATHGADDGAIDGAHVAVVFVGIVVARSSTCRNPPITREVRRRMPGSAAAPLPLLDAARLRCGSACLRIPGEPVQHAAHNVVVRVTAPIGKLGTGSYPQFVAMVSDATSA
jgi:hypothetical protein